MGTNTNPIITLTPQDLPLHCTGPNHETWNGHPNVYLPIQSNGRYECPYCSIVYHLKGEIKPHHY